MFHSLLRLFFLRQICILLQRVWDFLYLQGRFLISSDLESVMPLTRSTIAGKSTENPSTFNPKRCALFIASATSALCMSNLDGMQPLLRQVPPILFFSITATFSPCWYAALATSNPEPLAYDY